MKLLKIFQKNSIDNTTSAFISLALKELFQLKDSIAQFIAFTEAVRINKDHLAVVVGLFNYMSLFPRVSIRRGLHSDVAKFTKNKQMFLLTLTRTGIKTEV